MMYKTIIKAIDAVLDDWSKLNEKHRGQEYEKAVQSLTAWKAELVAKMNIT